MPFGMVQLKKTLYQKKRANFGGRTFEHRSCLIMPKEQQKLSS